MWTTRHGRLLGPGATVVQVDADPDAIGAHHRVDLAVVGDVAETVRDLLAELDRRDHRGGGWRTPQLADRIAAGALARRAARRRQRGRPDRPAHAVQGPGRRCCPPSARWPSTPATSWASRRCTCGAATRGVRLHPGVPGRRAGAGERDRRRGGAAGPADRGGARRRRRDDGAGRARDGRAAGAAHAGRGVYNDAAYGAEVHHFGPTATRSTWCSSRTSTSRHRAGRRPPGRARSGGSRTSRRSRPGSRRAPGAAAARRQGRPDRRRGVAGGGVPGALTTGHPPAAWFTSAVSCSRDTCRSSSTRTRSEPVTAAGPPRVDRSRRPASASRRRRGCPGSGGRRSRRGAPRRGPRPACSGPGGR